MPLQTSGKLESGCGVSIPVCDKGLLGKPSPVSCLGGASVYPLAKSSQLPLPKTLDLSNREFLGFTGEFGLST